jgi:hypothetical protein
MLRIVNKHDYTGNNSFCFSGHQVRLRHLRRGTELPPVSVDDNYDYNYQVYKRLQKPVTVYPVSTYLKDAFQFLTVISYITITILDNIHRPVFYLKLNSIV